MSFKIGDEVYRMLDLTRGCFQVRVINSASLVEAPGTKELIIAYTLHDKNSGQILSSGSGLYVDTELLGRSNRVEVEEFVRTFLTGKLEGLRTPPDTREAEITDVEKQLRSLL